MSRRDRTSILFKDNRLSLGESFGGAIVSGLYAALYQKQSLTTEILMNEVRSTVPLSVFCREDVDHLRAMAQEQFVNVR